MKQKLQDYVSGKVNYTPIMNFFLNNRSKDWYAELGRYISQTLDITKNPELEYFNKLLSKTRSVITKIKDFKNDRTYSSIGIFFMTAVLNAEALKKMFGEPLYHSEFGEGFDGEYDEETDEYGEPEIKEEYASYFVKVGNSNFHIGYDHRGTGVEIDKPISFSEKETQKVLEDLKKLVDFYKQKVN